MKHVIKYESPYEYGDFSSVRIELRAGSMTATEKNYRR